MKKLVILFLYTSLIACGTRTHESQTKNEFGDVPAPAPTHPSVDIDKFLKYPMPHLGYLVSQVGNATPTHLCSAVIIREKLALTRADCLYSGRFLSEHHLYFRQHSVEPSPSGWKHYKGNIEAHGLVINKYAQEAVELGNRIPIKHNWAIIYLKNNPKNNNGELDFPRLRRETFSLPEMRGMEIRTIQYSHHRKNNPYVTIAKKNSCEVKKTFQSDGFFYHNCPTASKKYRYGTPIFRGDRLVGLNAGSNGRFQQERYRDSGANIAIPMNIIYKATAYMSRIVTPGFECRGEQGAQRCLQRLREDLNSNY